VLYRKSLVRLGAHSLDLEDRDLDTGKPTRTDEYPLANATYAKMLHSIAGNKFKDVTPALRSNILSFFQDTSMRTGTKKDSVAWSRSLGELSALRDAELAAPPTGDPAKKPLDQR
jgi:hypothetical protein